MNNKNISLLIIFICLTSLFVGIIMPKSNSSQEELETNDNISYNSIKSFGSPFKGSKIKAIKLEGIITDSEGSSFFKNTTSSSAVLEQIIKATKDTTVKAIVLRINSPGGTVAASQEIYQALIRARKKKPIVITMGDVAASGGYYIASAGNSIYANPGTLTGSIGVITSYLNFTDLFKKFGVEGVTIKSGKFKDIGSSTRPLTETERKILQALLDNSYKQFIGDVAKGRGVPYENISMIAEGLIYTGEQAHKIGLVDHLGDYSKALAHAQKLAKEKFPEIGKKYGNKDLPVEEEWKSSSVLESFISSSIGKNEKFEAFFPQKFISQSKFQPLWIVE
jgi:protease-4